MQGEKKESEMPLGKLQMNKERQVVNSSCSLRNIDSEKEEVSPPEIRSMPLRQVIQPNASDDYERDRMRKDLFIEHMHSGN